MMILRWGDDNRSNGKVYRSNRVSRQSRTRTILWGTGSRRRSPGDYAGMGVPFLHCMPVSRISSSGYARSPSLDWTREASSAVEGAGLLAATRLDGRHELMWSGNRLPPRLSMLSSFYLQEMVRCYIGRKKSEETMEAIISIPS
jgi:hypothetical protein